MSLPLGEIYVELGHRNSFNLHTSASLQGLALASFFSATEHCTTNTASQLTP
jgi:hypothetical protein